MQVFSQEQEFLFFSVIGIVISFIFDIFRSLRKNFKTKDLMIYGEDILFLTISTFIFMFGIFYIANGMLRLYIFFGFFLGIIIYFLTFSKFCIIIINRFVVFFKTILFFLIKLFKSIGKKLHL